LSTVGVHGILVEKEGKYVVTCITNIFSKMVTNMDRQSVATFEHRLGTLISVLLLTTIT